ncbi:MAG: 7-carboxy-7-deazaguanine synthase QueE [Flavisolibacter sp.]|nr:7-carboxy-7-deazaguanine synthase QueE [Flavisolibacter sp.]
MEHFYTLQGEGFHQGKAAYFIRLAGCDVGCVWCDVKESWDASKYPLMTIEQIVANVHQNSSPTEGGREGAIVVITGGEPTLHNLDVLTKELREAGLRTHLETSGSSHLTGQWDWITLSPKKFKAPLPPILPQANELKVVIYHQSDFQWAEKYAAQVTSHCKLYLQPEWEKASLVTPLIIDYIKAHPQWQLSLQIHKYINVP